MDNGTDPIRKEFFERTVRKGFNKIFGLQRERLMYVGERSGRLRRFLYAPQMTVSPANVTVHYPIYIRFLDMRDKGNHRIYNRPIWGVVYKEIIPELQYGYTEQARRQIYNDLLRAVGADEKKLVEL